MSKTIYSDTTITDTYYGGYYKLCIEVLDNGKFIVGKRFTHEDGTIKNGFIYDDIRFHEKYNSIDELNDMIKLMEKAKRLAIIV
jgi:hypothetical protein